MWRPLNHVTEVNDVQSVQININGIFDDVVQGSLNGGLQAYKFAPVCRQ